MSNRQPLLKNLARWLDKPTDGKSRTTSSTTSPLRRFLVHSVLVVAPLGVGCIFLILAIARSPDTPEARAGVLDLTGWNLATSGPIRLDGDWEFYWDQLLTPSDFAGMTSTTPRLTGFIRIPSAWNTYPGPVGPLPGQGYATYRLTIRLPQSSGPGPIHQPSQPFFALRVPPASTALRVWVDGTLLAEGGQVGRNAAETRPQHQYQLVFFRPQQDTLEVVLQVANFNHSKGGIWHSLKLGEAAEVSREHASQLALDMLLFGFLLVTGIYNLSLYLLGDESESFLYFSLLAGLMSIRTLLVNSVALTHFLPDFNWELQLKLEYLTFYTGVPLFGLFLNALYPEEVTRQGLLPFRVTGAAFSLLVVLAPPRLFSQTLSFYQLVFLAAGVYYLLGIIRATRRKRLGAIYVLLGIPLLVATTLNDTLYYQQLVRTNDFTPFGILMFVFYQSFVLARRFQHTQELASIDPLCQVYNRNFLHRELERQLQVARRSQDHVAVAVIDLDNFKAYNDSHGHLPGDSLLREIARHLQSQLRKTDFIARYGGDEFVVVLPETQAAEADDIMHRLHHSLRQQVIPEDCDVRISWGIATFPNDGNDVETLLRKADRAMYRAKALRKNRTVPSHTGSAAPLEL
ncbi:MAG: diguanylate cyclase [Bacteroidota bacterium]